MMSKIKRVYWDSCSWIAYIKQETVVDEVTKEQERRFEMCKGILRDAEEGNIEIVTSAFTLAEVCKAPKVKDSGVDYIPSFFDKSYILLVPVDKSVGLKAQALQLAGVYGLKPADATHIASACIAECEELHTFDDDILSLDKKIIGANGLPMKICKPNQETELPLFSAVPEQRSKQS
jgi:predicted nucleic acid-binding protein